MKTLARNLTGIEVGTIKAAFFVLLGISLILGTVAALYYFKLVKEYSWQ